MGQLQHLSTQSAGPEAHMLALSALLIPPQDDAGQEGAGQGETGQGEAGQAAPFRLVSAGGAGGGVLVWDADLQLQGSGHYGSSDGLDAPRGLVLAELGGERLLLAPGRSGAGIEGWAYEAGALDEGALSTRRFFGYDDGTARALVALADVRAQGADLLVTAARDVDGVEVWRREGDALIAQAQDVQAATPGQVSAIASVGQGAAARVLVLSAEKNSLYSYAISPEGRLSDVRQLGPQDGLFLDTPSLLRCVQLAGQSYALIGAGSGAIAVVALQGGGGMQLTDLVGDDLQTRFAGVTAMATVTRDGQVYVAVAGRDDGISLLTLLPGGRLLHLATLADDTEMALSAPAALALAADASGIDIYAAGGVPDSAAGDGLSRLRAELGAVGLTRQLGGGADSHDGTPGNDQIHGGAGDDSLSGGAGDDVLIDGPGQDVLSGGPGADVFVFTADGQTDRITDFEPGTDRLDLSDLGRFYTVEALQIDSTARGARLVLNGEVTRIDSAQGQPLAAGDFDIADLRDLWHIDSSALPETPLTLSGSAGSDLLQGRAAADTIAGGPGADILRGGAGDDLLIGEAADPEFDPVSGQVFRLYRATLDRAPDMAGLLHWTARLLSGTRDLLSVTGGFTQSAEFRQTYGALDDAAFVTLLYRNVLERAPDAGGLAGWTGRLGEGMRREQVVLGFSESPELRASTAGEAVAFSRGALQQAWTDDVFRLYQATLDRSPDVSGLLHWSARLAEGRSYLSVVDGFVQSPEFQATYGPLGNAGFVGLLYRNVLGRDGEAAGLESWTARLEAGMSRAEVVRGFAQSPELIAASAPDLLAWMRGAGADDELDGGAGDNLLIGGMGRDRFTFHAEDARRHEVADLERWDVLQFEGFGYTEAAQIRAHLVQDDNAVRFSDQGTRVILQGVTQSDIHDDMFLF